MGGPSTLSAYASLHGARLMRAAVLLSGDVSSGQDLCQETLARMVTAWPRLRSADAAHAYALTTMTRLFHRLERRHWHSEISYESVPDEPVVGVDSAAVIDVRAGLAALPPGQRAALVLRYYADLSVADSATALGCSEGTVRSQCSRGLTALARLLNDPATGGNPR